MTPRRFRTLILLLSGMLATACGKDVITEVPESFGRVQLMSSSVSVERNGSAEIPFLYNCLSPSCTVSLRLRDGSLPRQFKASGVDGSGVEGVYALTIADNGVLPSYSEEVCVVITVNGVSVASDYICVSCGEPDYPPAPDTGLPVVYIDAETDLQHVSKGVDYPSVVRIKGSDGYPGMSPHSCIVSGRGNISRSWEKKPYNLEFRDRVSVLGLPESGRWALLANFTDRTLMRNMVAMKVASLTLRSWTPRCVPVELVLNGKHRGSYLLIERVEVSPERLNVSGNESCVLELDFHYDNEVQWKDPHGFSHLLFGIPFAVKYPSPGDLTPEREAYIRKYVSDAASALYSDSFADSAEGYAKWIDPDSFADYWIVFELLGNHELINPASVFFHKDTGGRLKAGPCWDFDWCLSDFWTAFQGKTGLVDKYAIWYRRLFMDPVFVGKVRQRFALLLPELEGIPEYIDECGKLLAPSAGLNFEMWNPATDRWQNKGLLINGDENLSHAEAVARLKEVYLRRLGLVKAFLDR